MALQLFKIADVTVASPQATVDFTSIPQGYTDLIVKVSARSLTGSPAWCLATFNGSTTSYNNRYLAGDGNAASSGNLASQTYLFTGVIVHSNYTANTFGNGEFYIPNYSVNGIAKSVSTDGVQENNGSGSSLAFWAGLWTGTAPITSISMTPQSSVLFATNSTFTLYGVL